MYSVKHAQNQPTDVQLCTQIEVSSPTAHFRAFFQVLSVDLPSGKMTLNSFVLFSKCSSASVVDY